MDRKVRCNVSFRGRLPLLPQFACRLQFADALFADYLVQFCPSQ